MTHIHSAGLDFQAGQWLARGRDGVDGIRQFNLAVRRFLPASM